ncbi:GFA family protein [Poseidonocella sp. HB161398]|uniref:GFA family protein n=1 Tax=Poseidonocella sp. HB161398 TaxID=2320855 RepID=UPI001486A327|nr:GFA family protein [Poseidonocella sp. HB161398]
MDAYLVSCSCGGTEIRLEGAPQVRGHCHRRACRVLLDVPFHSVTAWNPEQLAVTKGAGRLPSFRHPRLSMKTVSCRDCGTVLWNTNAMDWRVVAQRLIEISRGALPEELRAVSHFHYGSRLFGIAEDLPKTA